jgi:hypothetical protein
MRFRALLALVLVVATVALWADVAGAARASSVTIRRARFAGLQMDIAVVRTAGRVVVEPAQARGRVTSIRPVVRICGGCIVGINGDFFDGGNGLPVGGVIIHGVVLRSPNPRQNQLSFGPYGRISAGPMQWLGQIAFDDTTLPVAVNDPDAGTPVLYDRHFGARTPHGTATEFRFAPRSTALQLGRTMRLQYRGRHVPGRRIRPGEVVLRASGPFGQQLRDLKGRLDAGTTRTTINLATDPVAANSLGANHVLVRGGHVQPIPENSSFVYGAHPRTIFGWNGRGKVWLVTIGSAAPGRRAGVSLPVAAQLVKNLGATNAVNLDGGGSSTFVARGRIRNHPSDGRPRSVTNAWIVVRRRPAAHRKARVAPATRLRSVDGRVSQRALDDATHDPAGVAEDVRVAPGAGEHEPAFDRGDDRGRELSCVVGRDAGRGEASRRGVDPTREHLRGRDAQGLVRARDLPRDGADRTRIDEVGLLEHRRRGVEEVGDRRFRTRCLVGDGFEELPVGGARGRDHRGGEFVLAPGEEVVQRPGRRLRR